MKWQEYMSQKKEQDKTPENKTKHYVKWRQASSGKRFQNNDSEDDPGYWKKNGGKD